MFSVSSFWQKLSKKEKTVAYIAIAAVFIAFFDGFIFQSILGKIRSIEDQIKTTELLIRKNMKMLAEKDMIAAQEQRYSDYSIEAKSQEEEILSVLKEIETLASKSSVNLIEVKPTDLKSEKIIKRYSISISCEATMEQLANFMYQLEISKAIFTIDSYSLVSKDKDKGILRCAMVISKVVVP